MCVDLKDVDYNSIVYLCTAWQNKYPPALQNLKKNYYNYLIHLKNINYYDTKLIDLSAVPIDSHLEKISKGHYNKGAQSIFENIEKLEKKHNDFNKKLIQKKLKEIIKSPKISYEDRLIYEAIQKESEKLAQSNSETPYNFEKMILYRLI